MSTRPSHSRLDHYFSEILGTRKKITRLVNYVFQKVRLEKLVKLVFQEFRVISLKFPENAALLVVRARRAPVYRDLNGFLYVKGLYIKKFSRCAASNFKS